MVNGVYPLFFQSLDFQGGRGEGGVRSEMNFEIKNSFAKINITKGILAKRMEDFFTIIFHIYIYIFYFLIYLGVLERRLPLAVYYNPIG